MQTTMVPILFVFLTFFFTAGGEVVTFNVEPDSSEDNVDLLLEMEQLLTVRQKRPPSSSSLQQQQRQKQAQSSSSSSLPAASSDIPSSPISSPSHSSALKERNPAAHKAALSEHSTNVPASSSSSSSLSSSPERTFQHRDSAPSIEESNPSGVSSSSAKVGDSVMAERKKGNSSISGGIKMHPPAPRAGWAGTTWEELGASDVLDDDLLFLFEEENRLDPEEILFREKRQVVDPITVVSGQDSVDFEITLDGTIPAGDDTALRISIATSVDNYLESDLPTTTADDITVQVSTLTAGSIVVTGVIAFPDELTLTQVAQSLEDLDTLNVLVVDGVDKTVDFPTLNARPAICYLCEDFETCEIDSDNHWQCVVSDTNFFPFGVDEGDSTLEHRGQDVSIELQLENPIPYASTPVNNIWISCNGIVSFGQDFTSSNVEPLPVGTFNLLAPYWSAMVLEPNDTTADAFYHLYERQSLDSLTPAEEAILEKANNLVTTYGNDVTSYDAACVLVVTWYKMPHWRGSSNGERVTFQAVIISDGSTSYAFFIYAQGGLNFDPLSNFDIEVGWGSTSFDTSPINYFTFDRITGNTGVDGQWIVDKFGFIPGSAAKCLSWYSSQNFTKIAEMNNVVDKCPCNMDAVIILFQQILDSSGIEIPPSSICFDTAINPENYGRRCCYNFNINGLRARGFLNTRPFAGYLQKTSPFISEAQNDLDDKLPRRYCCRQSNLCHLFYQARPTGTCNNLNFFEIAELFGDPHITTLDQREYTFNGLGEYVLIKIDGVAGDDAEPTNFVLQARTCRALTENGNETDATVWCAVAFRGSNNESAHIEIHSSGDYMVIYINGEDFTGRFRDNTIENLETTGVLKNGVLIQKANETLKLSLPNDGIQLDVTLSSFKMLNFAPYLMNKFSGMPTGLLGNFDGDATNDFVQPDGTVLSNDLTDEQLFNYGQLWKITPEESVFLYFGTNAATTFSNNTFVPIFLDTQDQAVLDEAETFCGGADNIACVFDFIATGNSDLAQDTKDTNTQFQEDRTIKENEAPEVTGPSRIVATVGSLTTTEFTATDIAGGVPVAGDVTFNFIASPPESVFSYSEDSNTLTANFTPSDVSVVNFQFVATDSLGLDSEIKALEIVICRLCSSQGSCDLNNLQVSEENDNFFIAPCVCQPPYTGDECEEDLDACDALPCPAQTECTDIEASEQEITGIAFECSDCPDGLLLNNITYRCEDVNECLASNACPDNSQCENNYGSFECICDAGYRKNSAGLCIDIDECTENTNQCEQICINTDGSYTCDCFDGFVLEGIPGMQYNCSQVKDPCEDYVSDHNCTYSCGLNANNETVCLCPIGFELNQDGITCDDVDECQENLCSQVCLNSAGSYSCSCFDGFTLNTDRQACDPCEENFYGENCGYQCECRGRAVRCDNTRGCICQPEWTGTYCETDVDECSTLINPCPPDKLCRNVNGSYVCECPTGFEDLTGDGNCTDIDECATPSISQCEDLCINNPGSFSCSCDIGYNLVNGVCVDIDECTTGITSCQQQCQNVEGSYNCFCEQGYVLADDRSNCTLEEDVCRDFNVTCEYFCRLTDSQPECFCPLGFLLSGDLSNCYDVNECNNDHGCEGECNNIPGSYQCGCQIGQQLMNDRRSCKDCDDYHWGENCNNTCACNPLGTTTCDPVTGCQCIEGWQGEYCDNDVDECGYAQSPCPEGAVCVNTAGSYHCECRVGYQDQDGTCVDIDECNINTCDHMCNNTIGSYLCTCFDGFVEDGDDCEDIDECLISELNQCNQICRNVPGGYYCECFPGFSLNLTNRLICEVIDTCSASNNCSHDCRLENGVDTCFCPPGFELVNDTECENIDECDRSSPCASICADLEGSFECSCNDGFRLGDDLVSCLACDPGTFGTNCDEDCTCVEESTISCSAVDGTCDCVPGFNETNCSGDINECEADPCPSNSRCENNRGSFRCICDIGFVAVEGVCQACDEVHYGVDCLQDCSCVEANTEDCDDIDGNCTCLSGWRGDICDEDIDECVENNECTDDFEVCININGSFICGCEPGYERLDIGSECTECNSIHWGDNCAERCTCVYSQTEDCNNVNGTCFCKSGWTGTNCEEDIDECEDDNYCLAVVETCVNLNGSARCDCSPGYQANSTGDCIDIDECLYPSLDTCEIPEICFNSPGGFECIGDFEFYPITIVFGYNDRVIDSDIYFNSSQAYRDFREKVEAALLRYGITNIGDQIYRVIMSTFVDGSVIGDGFAVINTTLTDQPRSDAAQLAYLINNEGTLVIDGEDVSVSVGEFNGESVTDTFTTLCDFFNAVTTCPEGTACGDSDEDGSPSCEAVSSDSDYELIVGLGVGIPLFILVTVVIAILVYMYVRRKKDEKSTLNSTGSVDHDAPFRSVFATQMATKGSWGAPARFQMYSPDSYSETASSHGSSNGDGQLLKVRQKGRSDFQDSPWYDNRGGAGPSTPRDLAESRGAPTDAAGPTSNFSWDNMFRLLEPYKEFEIQRPNLLPSANPMFTPRGNNRNGNGNPDSMA